MLRFRELAAHVTSAAPSEDAELLHCGVEALDDELRWFKVGHCGCARLPHGTDQ